jgi:ATP-dependent Clp protease ATP-binding subunit ClpB
MRIANLLQVMDEGQLTDSHGKRVDFRNTLVVLTSNLGADELAALPEGASSEEVIPHSWFHTRDSADWDPGLTAQPVISQARPQVMEAVAKALPPEFVNRLDQIVLFNRLPRDEISQIAKIELRKVRKRLSSQGMGLRASKAAVQWLADAGAC